MNLALAADDYPDDAPYFGRASFPPPRPFQSTAHDALRAAAAAGHKNQMVMAPTGAGKLYLGLRVCHEALARGKRAVFVCDRTTLIDQASAVADKYGIAHGVMQSNHWRYRRHEPFQICSAQTIARRQWPDADVIVIDEAHTQLKAWTNHIPNCRARVVGLSATPFSRGLGRLFTNLVNATTAHELTSSGVLVPMRVFSCTRANMADAEVIAGEWSDKAAEQRGMEIIGDVVSEWIKFAEGRKTIVFGATIAHCEEMASAFNAVGVQAAVFSAHTLPHERAALLKEYRKPDSSLRVLISVEALAKGFDVQDVGCVVDCRPLRKSLSTAMQMWGRGLRSSPETGKTDCILLDHTGNILRFAKDYTRIYHEGLDALDSGEKLDKAVRTEKDEAEAKACPKCKAIPFVGKCMFCGFEASKPAALVQALPGSMREITLPHGKSTTARALWSEVCTYARQHNAPERQHKQALALYRSISGGWPPRDWTFDDTPNVPLSREVLNKIKADRIRWIKGRARQAA